MTLCINVSWLVLFLIPQFRSQTARDEVHAAERELWRAERQILQARALRPAPSIRRPEDGAALGRVEDGIAEFVHAAKLGELKRIAGGGQGYIVPTDS